MKYLLQKPSWRWRESEVMTGCEAFMSANAHNHEPRLFVDSAQRNNEW